MTNRPVKNKNTDDDLALITAINSGQVASFHTLVDKYSRRLYNFGLKMCKDVRDAEDLVQDTFLNVF